MQQLKFDYHYDRCSGRSEVSTYVKGAIYSMYPPYTKETVYDKSSQTKQEWKRHYYMIMTDPNFQGFVQVMQLTSTPEPENGFPIGLPITMSINDKNGRLRCDGVWNVHHTHFQMNYFSGIYAPRRSTGLPDVDEFTTLCFKFYMVINQIIDYRTAEGQQILQEVDNYIKAYEMWHTRQYRKTEPSTPIFAAAEKEEEKPTPAQIFTTAEKEEEEKPIPTPVIITTTVIPPEPKHVPEPEPEPEPTPAPEPKVEKKKRDVNVIPIVTQSSIAKREEAYKLTNMEALKARFYKKDNPKMWSDLDIATYSYAEIYNPDKSKIMDYTGRSSMAGVDALTQAVRAEGFKRGILDEEGHPIKKTS